MAPAPRRPHIIVICSDQHRAAAMGAYGNPICKTPHLDRLAARGVLMERCYAQNPVCSPQRCSIFTGLLSRNHGVMTNKGALSRDIPTLPGVLKAHGYRTVSVGKLHLEPFGAKQPVPGETYYGIDHAEALDDSRVGPYLDWVLENFPKHAGYSIGCLFNLSDDDAYWRGKRDFRKEYLEAREKYVKPLEISPTCNWGFGHYSPLPEDAHQNTWITDRVLDCVNRHDPSEPLFLWASYVDPHNPFDPPGRFQRMYSPDEVDPPLRRPGEEAGWSVHHRAIYDRYLGNFTQRDWLVLKALYYGSVTFMDEQIGRLIAGVEKRLDMSNTIVVYISDHGEILGDHGICGKTAYHFDSCIRVPFIARWDGKWAGGKRTDEIVELTDLMPTLLEAAGVPGPAKMDGRSNAGLLEGRAGYKGRGHGYVESYSGGPEDPTPPPITWAKSIRTDRWRATFYPDPPEATRGELFDMHNDPTEFDNRWNDPACRAVIEEHRAILLRRMMLMDFPLRQ